MKHPPAKAPQPKQAQTADKINGAEKTHESFSIASFDDSNPGVNVHGQPKSSTPSLGLNEEAPVQFSLLSSRAKIAPTAAEPEEEPAWKRNIMGVSSDSASNARPTSASTGPLKDVLGELRKNDFKNRDHDEPHHAKPTKSYNLREGLKHVGVEAMKGAAGDAAKGALVGAGGGTAVLPGLGTVAGAAAGAGIGATLGGIGGAATGTVDVARSKMGKKATDKAGQAASEQTHTISQLANQTGQIQRQVTSNTTAIAALKNHSK